ncbi:hypothetical protein BU17DRAFT_69067 [Hysterangium stoloniferum]|nr:hypothetical protein BU17DRAFT_69067 [Hysterangium stoloniferum]
MDKYPQLPLELVIMIFEIAARDHRATGTTLCLVSRWVQELWNQYYIGCLGILYGSMVIDTNRIAHPPLPSVQNFATDSTFYTMDLVATDVEEFHLLDDHPFGRILFPRLKRLHYSGEYVPQLGPTCPVQQIISHKELTHVAFSAPEDMSDLIPIVKEILKEHKPLEVLYIRLLRSTSLVLRGGPDRESMEVRLRSIGDPRLVVRRVGIYFSAETLLDEWERMALSGESFWDGAQNQLDGRKESVRQI